MSKLSVLIPSRNEKYLVPTVEDCFAKAEGEVEVVVHLDGYWPENWGAVVDKYPNLHTIHSGEPKGLRPGVNAAAASAISRKAKYLLKLDAHCMLDQGYDVKLKQDIERNWIVVPRRKRLNPETWSLTDTHKLDIDYHFLSFPSDPNDFGGKGLNGKVWEERTRERRGKPEYDVDWEMSSQGSAWCIHSSYFTELELLDTESYGSFWNEAQEFGLKAWLSGGRLMINKKTWYAHWHKGKAGRGYNLQESLLRQGATYTKRWLFNEAWPKQTLPFKSLIERFWPVPTWPEDWEEKVYQGKGKVWPGAAIGQIVGNVPNMEFSGPLPSGTQEGDLIVGTVEPLKPQLQIHSAYYGIGPYAGENVDVTERVRSLVSNDSLDIVVNNATLVPEQNPFRGKKKHLQVRYSINGGDTVKIERQEKEWLIIGPVAQASESKRSFKESITKALETGHDTDIARGLIKAGVDMYLDAYQAASNVTANAPRTAAALNDYLIRKFHISDRRLRAPMPVELRDFNRNDLAKLFAELGFKYGAEIGVAEGHYSEILCQSIPGLRLYCVDPWTRYSENPRAHSEEHQKFSRKETERKLKGYNATIIDEMSMNVVRDFALELDFVYIDANHQFDYVMQDLIEWSKRVRSGGIVAGDDYYAMKHQGGVVAAVDAYVKAHGVALWFLIDAPNSVDFFWVKS